MPDAGASIWGPMLIGGGSSLLGGLMGGGKQGKSTTDSSSSSTGTQEQSGTYRGLRNPLEPDYFSQFRQGLMGQFGQEFNKVQQPLYEDAQKSSFMQTLNALANSSMQSMSSNLARRGLGQSGLAAMSGDQIMGSRFNKAAEFFSQIPFLNEQARRTATSTLLGQGINWAGAAPLGEEITNTQQSSTKSQQNTTGSQQQQMYGPPMWQTGLAGLGNFGAGLGANWLTGKAKNPFGSG